jgi:hypothetical protein
MGRGGTGGPQTSFAGGTTAEMAAGFTSSRIFSCTSGSWISITLIGALPDSSPGDRFLPVGQGMWPVSHISAISIDIFV